MDAKEFKRRADRLRQMADQIERGEKPTATNWDLEGVSAAKLRELADNLEHAPGARERELLAQWLLFHPEQLRQSSPADREVLKTFLKDRPWESMRETDPAMYQTLVAAVAKLDPARLDL
jgi:hypothetical protein